MTTVGEALVAALVARGVTTVFGIPGVHTVELYRGLAGAPIRHVTPRHEQGAGFMADGYARVSGQPGVAFVITGPGLTNTLTAMGQARADSVPMLVISGVNARATLGKGRGELHELPDQHAMAALVALSSAQVDAPEALGPALAAADALFASGRPGPVHIEVPLDVMPLAAPALPAPAAPALSEPDAAALAEAARMLAKARAPVILVGGGAKRADAPLRALAERLGAPVIQTTNARGLMHGHPLTVPASPTLAPVRDLVRSADLVLAIGTEFGATDYDMFSDGGFPVPAALIRVEIDAARSAVPPANVILHSHAEAALPALLAALPDGAATDGADRARATRDAVLASLDAAARDQIAILETIRDTVPGAILVGDSTQAIYAGNAYYDHDRPGGWFNAATGFGALGYAIPAAIGAALADPAAPVLCLTGDGGAQFSLPELMTAVDEALPITFLVWNNSAYFEIARAMDAVEVPVLGCHPTPPDFAAVALSCGMPYTKVAMTPATIAAALVAQRAGSGPVMIEIDATEEGLAYR